MDLSLIISVVGNILLFLLLVLFIILYFTSYGTNKPSIVCPPSPPGPPQPVVPVICTDASCNYILKTLDGKYITSKSNSDLSIVASDKFNGDTISFTGSLGSYKIQMNVASDPSGVYYFNLAPQTITKGVVKLTTNPNDRGTQFNLIPYLFSFQTNNGGSNLYQIGTPISNTLLGEAQTNCMTKDGIPIVDGFNFYVNAPKGLDSRSLFLILPSNTYGPNPNPIVPTPTPITPPTPSPTPSPVPSPALSPVPTLSETLPPIPQSNNNLSRNSVSQNHLSSKNSFVSFDFF